MARSKKMKMSQDSISPLIIILVLALISFLVFIVCKANRESYLLTEKDFYPIDKGYLFQQNIADENQNQDYGCGC